MARVDAALSFRSCPTLSATTRTGVPYGVALAPVPELALEARPPWMTNDADITHRRSVLSEFVKGSTARYGFERTPLAYRLRHRSGGILDVLLPTARRLHQTTGYLADDPVQPGGLATSFRKAVPTIIDDGPIPPLAPQSPSMHCSSWIAEGATVESEDPVVCCIALSTTSKTTTGATRWSGDGAGCPSTTCAWHLLGLDVRLLLDPSISKAVRAVLDRFGDADAHVVGLAAAERGRRADDDRRSYVFGALSAGIDLGPRWKAGQVEARMA